MTSIIVLIDNFPSEEPPATAEKEEETEQSDREGESITIMNKSLNFIDFYLHTQKLIPSWRIYLKSIAITH